MLRPKTGCAILVRGARDRGIGILSRGRHRRRGERIQRLAGRGAQEPAAACCSARRTSPTAIWSERRLPRSSVSAGVQPGRGLANLGDGELTLLQLPQG